MPLLITLLLSLAVLCLKEKSLCLLRDKETQEKEVQINVCVCVCVSGVGCVEGSTAAGDVRLCGEGRAALLNGQPAQRDERA